MIMKDKRYEKTIELAPSDWLFWKDEDFNNWRRLHDFPRIVEFLFDNLPYFPLWLSEQVGLTVEDLLFHGPSRFIKSYEEEAYYIKHDAGLSFLSDMPARQIVKYIFVAKSEIENTSRLKILQKVKFTSYIDWAFSNKNWALPNKLKDIRDISLCLAPSGITSETPDYLDSHSNIQFNIPLFMPNIPWKLLKSKISSKAPPRLELLKLGGKEVEVINGVIGEKNLEFTNIDNLRLISPIITSFQTIAFSTLRNLKIAGSVHAITFHQCSTNITIIAGNLASCKFEHGAQQIELKNSKLDRTLIKTRQLKLKLSDTEVLDCRFEYSVPFSFSAKEKRDFHKSAKMIFSHLGYPDQAGEHFLQEKKSERKNMWAVFSSFKRGVKIGTRLYALLGFVRMSIQELYWGYGEKPFNIILSSTGLILTISLFCYFKQDSSTFSDAMKSITFSFQSFTNITITEIKQTSEWLNMLGAVMSFFGLMSVGLLVASLSSKSKDYN
ncbi:hypothetical protein AWV77_22405 [Pseudomonas palleroniana]|uniref:Uncharacterized protein n=2 Tax=Pseudomonas palleroniana TaxID=191390 RepID=A0A0X7JZ19_9PSED|nr:hypothetical protein AWV77_22405 [Pseudomonas palleroniana]